MERGDPGPSSSKASSSRSRSHSQQQQTDDPSQATNLLGGRTFRAPVGWNNYNAPPLQGIVDDRPTGPGLDHLYALEDPNVGLALGRGGLNNPQNPQYRPHQHYQPGPAPVRPPGGDLQLRPPWPRGP